MILSASRRTDIPSYYGEWFMNRVRAGEVWLQNPVNHAQNQRLRFSSDTVDCIVFWTKSPAPFLRYLPELDAMGYRYVFQYTLNPYGAELEPELPSLSDRVDTFLRLSERIGPDRVLWRYDPIVLNEAWTAARHAGAFRSLCDALAGATAQVTVSFVQKYQKIRDPNIRALTEEEKRCCADVLGQTAAEYRLPIQACCARMDLSGYGIRPASCIDRELLERVVGAPLSLRPDHGQRKGCGCCESVDVGMYNTCPRGCVYCYATLSRPLVERNFAAYDPGAPMLSGGCDPSLLRDRTAASNKLLFENEQITF